jgi:hypothetical protein
LKEIRRTPMKRLLPLALALLAALGCYHDNASPFVHGGGNKPPAWGSTWAPASGSRTDTTGVASYSASSGYAGGYDKEYGGGSSIPGTSTSVGMSPNAMNAPTGSPTPLTTTAAPQHVTPPVATQSATPQ